MDTIYYLVSWRKEFRGRPWEDLDEDAPFFLSPDDAWDYLRERHRSEYESWISKKKKKKNEEKEAEYQEKFARWKVLTEAGLEAGPEPKSPVPDEEYPTLDEWLNGHEYRDDDWVETGYGVRNGKLYRKENS